MSLTYSTLQSQIKDILENDGSEFSDAVPSFIDRGEWRLFREIDSLGLNRYAASNFNIGDPFLSKPVETAIIRSINYKTAEGNRIQLLQATNEYITDYWPVRTSVGSPRYYSNFGYDRILVAPTPSSTSNVEMEYIVKPVSLADNNQTNYFTDYASNALLYACLIEGCYYMKNPSAVAYWEKRYTEEVAALNNEARRTRRDDMIVAANPSGGEDNLISGT
tara:strand:- start:31036 stop:31695 length:660 start_codon:yes stop_codon:yes gene_type:complete